MQREILFRGKRIDNGRWIEGYFLEFELCDGKGKRKYIKVDGYPPAAVDPETVGQFTGRTDKKEVKIFEGDIIKEKDSNSLMERIYSVFWNEDYMQFWICDDVTLDSNSLDVLEFDYSEVIGNIYDNKDLLG